MASMEYKGYIGVIEIDNENEMLHGSVVNARDVITFEGRTVEELKQALHDSVEFYLKVCKKHGREPEKPASGKFQIRLDPELHRDLMRVAALRATSINNVAKDAIKTEVKRELAGV